MQGFLKKLFNKKSYQLHNCLPTLKDTKGSVLIEFVACVPLLIILLLYIIDIVKIGRLNAQTEFVAYETANIIQNIASDKNVESNTQTTVPPPKISKSDLICAYAASWLHLYAGNSMFFDTHSGKTNHSPMTIIWYIKGNADGTATCMWGALISSITNEAKFPADLKVTVLSSGYEGSAITWGEGVDPSSIYPNLQVNPEGEKIIVETIIAHNPKNSSVSPKQALGLFGTLPRHKHSTYYYFVNSVISFSPKPLLFKDDSDLYFMQED